MRIREHLDLDVARLLEIALEKDRVVAEGALCGALRSVERAAQLLLIASHAHADATTARARLEEHLIADLLCGSNGFLDVAERIRPRNHRYAGVAHALSRGHLLAHRRHRVGGRPDEHDAVLLARARELLVLAEESVAWVNRLRTGRPRCVDDAIDHEV